MKSFLGLTAALAMTATSVFADAEYPVEVVRNGVTYDCKPISTSAAGTPEYRCLAPEGAALFAGGLSAGTIVLLGIGGAAAIAAISSGGGNSTNGTN